MAWYGISRRAADEKYKPCRLLKYPTARQDTVQASSRRARIQLIGYKRGCACRVIWNGSGPVDIEPYRACFETVDKRFIWHCSYTALQHIRRCIRAENQHR